MIYYTKIEFKPNMDGFKFLGKKNLNYEIHQLVENLQPNMTANDRILWRFEELKDRMPFVLVQTNFLPNIERMKSHLNYNKFLKDEILFKSLNLNSIKGEKFFFKLRANPTKTKNKKRIPIGIPSKEKLFETQNNEISTWLKNKETLHGFSILNYDFYNENIIEMNISKNKELSAVFNSILFSGTLMVHDPEKFKKTIENGIGSAKGFGFGLLSIKKL